MRALVTGVAGFIGSHLAESLIAGGHQVVGVDGFTDYYDTSLKQRNLLGLLQSGAFELVEADLRETDLDSLVDGAEVVFHLAGQPGVRTSFGDGFRDYCGHNILATQRLLESCQSSRVRRFVFSSSSSVYGNSASYPTREADLPRPFSPYGVTKLAAEHLCTLYASNWGFPTVSLRYFTVYGPRQRPDMAMQRLIQAAVNDCPFPLYGDGAQVRDFTYVEDVVQANIKAATADVEPGTVVNISGGSSASMLEVIDLVERLTGKRVVLDRLSSQAGDVRRTGASIERATRLLRWEPVVGLEQGLELQIRSVGAGT